MANTSTSWSWKITPDELKHQVHNYKSLKITQSYRGISVLIIGGLLLLSLVLAFFGLYQLQDIILGLFIYIPLLFFVYKGHRWAIILLMILWTWEKAYTLYLSVQSHYSPIPSIIWWLIVLPYIYKALQVENEYRKTIRALPIVGSGPFCVNCGTQQAKDAKFCTSCGKQIN